MKKAIIPTLFFFICGIAYMLDWIIFAEKNNDLYDGFPELKAKYVSRFPEALHLLFENNPQPAAILAFIVFTVCGFVFFKNNTIIFKVLGVIAFLLAFWNLFSIM